MPSPFPGMDPFIENQEWSDFHPNLIVRIQESLVPKVSPRYLVRIERRVYVEHSSDGDREWVRPDVTVLDRDRTPGPGSGGTALATELEPIVLTLPMPETLRESYLIVRERETMEVVTVIEVLSPGNKRPGADGRREYLGKREEVLGSASHLVELDLLRGGDRLPTVQPLPEGDYYAFVSRANRRPRVEVYAWPLRRALPTIPIPLSNGDPDVSLDLQKALNTVYDRAGYSYSLDYSHPLRPPLSDAEQTWFRQFLPKV